MKISSIIKDKKLYQNIFPYNNYDFQTINPFNNKLIKKYDFDSIEQIQTKIKNSNLIFQKWKSTSLENRLIKMKNLSITLESKKIELANLITLEMGKPINESLAEINKSINHINFYLKNSENFLKPKNLNFEGFENNIEYSPLGVVLCINPWNFPVWVGFKSIIPCLIAGNTILFKPSPTVPQTNILIEEIFNLSGFEGEYVNCFAHPDHISTYLISNRYIRHVIFTGSSKVGAFIGENAAKNYKKALLELGGSDPFIVFDDCDLEKVIYYI
jgi:succinate-semialdehyde dehydrogenase/glutarate-semialdehyde dehydrogenase